ncbi:MAG TPA: IPTL-CTERM sorting domain-containing protein [Casimicrobiaceae bacterium]|nr:IPTL-CTERM sorting domain-containing protein [Casimicrobiaceae bacterium]
MSATLRARNRGPVRKVLAWAALAILAAFAAAAGAQTYTVTRTSHTILFADDAHSTSHLCNYAAYRITADAAVTDVWATIGNFAGGRITLAATEDGVYHVGAIPLAGYRMAYFYLCGDTVPAIGELIGGQTHTLTLWDRDPSLPGASVVDTTNWSLTYAHAHINANSNKIDAVTIDPPDPVLGQTFTIRVDGRTGTVGSDEHLVFTPAAHATWPAASFELVAATIDLPDVGPDTHILVDELVHTGLAVNSANTPYFAIYTFRVTAPTTDDTQVNPYSFIDSGQNLKHTDVSHVVYPVIPPTPNPATLTKSANPTLIVQAATALPAVDVTFTVTINNSDDHAITLDELRDTLPPAFTYTAGSATYAGGAIADPLVASQNLTWIGSFAVPAQSTRTLVFHATVPGNVAVGTYDNCATARINGTQIDLTADPTDNAPACARVSVIATPPAGGTIVITKTTIGGGGSFSFTATPAPPLSDFAIDASAGSGVRTFTGLGANTYVVTETVPGGWSLTAINCAINPSTGGSFTPNVAGASVSITLGAGTVQAQCEFVNTRRGSITVVKEATPEVGQAFTFNTSGFASSFEVTPPGTPEQTFANLAAGSYSVAELVPAGWTLAGLECSITLAGSNTTTFAYTGAPSGDTGVFQPGDTTAAITLGAGDDVRCVFSDVQNGSITIVKQSSGGNGTFAFDTNGSPGSAEVILDTVAGTAQAAAFASAPPGTYAISELVASNWRLTSITCVSAGGSEFAYVGSPSAGATPDFFDLGDATAEISLAAGDAVTCLFTNEAVAQIPVPTLSDAMLVLLATLMLAAGVVSLRASRRFPPH